MNPDSNWSDSSLVTSFNAALLVVALGHKRMMLMGGLMFVVSIGLIFISSGYAARRGRAKTVTDGFRLGAARRLIGGTASVWLVGLAVALTILPTPLAGFQTQHLPDLSTASSITLSITLYFGLIRRRLQRGEAGPPAGRVLQPTDRGTGRSQHQEKRAREL